MSDTPEATHGTRHDPWYGSYAERAEEMRASEIRALFAVASRPEVVSLAGGMPYLDGLPFEQLGEAVKRMLVDQGTTMLQYGSAQGDEHLRELICDIVRLEGIQAHADDIVVTSGSQQGLDLIARIFCDPHDVVLAEAPNYVGALGVFRSYQVDVVNVPLDANGLVPEELERVLQEQERAGKRVKLLYTVPNFQNPAGVTMSEERRPRVLEIARRHHVLVLEDNPYGLLSFDGALHPALRSLDTDGVVYLGSFSKIMAPGFRVGWMIAPLGIREKLVLANESAVLCPSNASQMTLSAYLDGFDWKSQIASFRDIYRERRDAMVGALEEMCPSCTWNVPTGGFYVWLGLPTGLDSRAMLPRAVTARVAYVAGTAFYANGEGTDHMRLSFCYPTPERIREGIRRLAGVIENELELVQIFGTGARPDPDTTDIENPGPAVA